MDRKIDELYKRIIYNAYIPQRFKEKSFDNYKPSEKNEKVYKEVLNFARKFYDHYENGGWLLMKGRYGTGKTHLAIAIIKKAAYWFASNYAEKRTDYPVDAIATKENLRPILFKNVTDLLQNIKKAYNHIDVDEDQVMWKYQTKPLLVIDDLGAEKPSDWQQEKLYSILDYRYRELKPTVITTNYSMGELIDRVSQRVVERIQEASQKTGFRGESYRMGGQS